MNVLVAGGAGFIGSHLADALLDLGHTVVCVDNFLIGTKANITHLRDHPRFTFYEQDICDSVGLRAVFERERVEYVFHLAANSDIQAGGRDPLVDLNNTYLTTFNLLECMRAFDVKRLFFSSTSAVYGEQEGRRVREDDSLLRPVSYYGAAKLGSEALISASTSLHGLSSLVFRFPNVIGPRLTHGVIFDFIRKLKADPACLRILGDGKQTKPYLYVGDLVEGITRFMNAPQGVTLYNIGAETGTSVTEIADIVCGAMGLNDIRYEYSGGRGGWPGDVPEFAYNLAKIHAAGWRAQYTSREAVAKTAEELCKR